MPSKISFYGPSNQMAIARRVLRYGQTLRPAEFAVYCFVYDRTMMWKKEWESIPYDHFIKGVLSANGKRWHHGIGLKEQALKKAIRGCVEKGAIHRMRIGLSWSGTCYSINLQWEPVGICPLFAPQLTKPTAEEVLKIRGGGD